MGIFRDFRSLILRSSTSTQSTRWPRSAKQTPEMSPTWPVPMIEMFMGDVHSPLQRVYDFCRGRTVSGIAGADAPLSVRRRLEELTGLVQVAPARAGLAQELRDEGHQEAVFVAGEVPLVHRLHGEVVKVARQDHFLLQVLPGPEVVLAEHGHGPLRRQGPRHPEGEGVGDPLYPLLAHREGEPLDRVDVEA